MQGVKRVITFCLLITILPTFLLILPLYLRHNLYADVIYAVTESDVLEISDGVSTIFCSAHTLHTNGTINAFQTRHRPEITSNRVHLRLKKSMTLPDDTLEYWGFYLLRGATVALSVCSRFPGASVLVVKGERTLRTCGMLDHNKNKQRSQGIFSPAKDNVRITFESNAHVIHSNEAHTKEKNHTQRQNQEIRHYNTSVENSIRKKRLSNFDIENKISKNKEKEKLIKIKLLEKELSYSGSDASEEESEETHEKLRRFHHRRFKRNQDPVKPPALLNQGIKHGGNAVRNLTGDEDSSVSSFEEGLLNCYEGNVLLAQEFDPSVLCINISFLENSNYMQTRHNVAEDGYYYYIFYSDNDFVSNDIFAVFDIYKPSFQYENVTKSCLNQSECTFPLSMLSSDRLIVEIPTKDGIDHEEDDISILISVCHPRMGIYILFPIAVLFFILSCAFL